VAKVQLSQDKYVLGLCRMHGVGAHPALVGQSGKSVCVLDQSVTKVVN
jgi:hypothetical protein